MGYRHRMYIVDRKRIEEVKNLTFDELKHYASSNGVFEEDEDEFSAYSFLMGLCENKEFFNFGKYYDNYENIQQLGTPLFSCAETQECFAEYEPYVIEQNAVLCAVEHYRQKIISWYKGLLMTQEEYDATHELWERDKQKQEDRVRRHLENQLSEWENNFGITAVDLDMKYDRIVRSWLYEYEIFELVHQMKIMDWKNNVLVFCGW